MFRTSAYHGHRLASFFRVQLLLFVLLAIFLVPKAKAIHGHVTHHRHRQSGEEHGGQQPISGSRLYLYAISTSGYGFSPISLLNGPNVSYDSFGHGYVLTSPTGEFDITNLYVSSCPANDAYVYLQALGGDPGDGSDNSAIDLVAMMPLTCLNLPNAGTVEINELTTVAAAWGMLRYANVSTPSFNNGSTPSFSASNGNPQALLNAVNYVNSLVSGYTAAIGTNPFGGSLTVPVSKINSMGNILAECVNGPSSGFGCTQLFGFATPPGGLSMAPTDTLQAAIDIALNPTNNVVNLYYQIPAVPPFEPSLTTYPLDWTITYGIGTGSGIQRSSVTIDHTKVANTSQVNFPIAISIPANQNLTTISNGGFVNSPSGYDILFSSDAAGQSLLDSEIDNYNPTTGAATFWVRIPALSSTTDTTIYLWYGIPNINNSLENALGVWSNNYLSVYHFGNGTMLGLMDSAIAGYNLQAASNAAPGATLVEGQIGGAALFNGTSSQGLYHWGVPAYPSGIAAATIEVWENNATGSGLVGYGDVYNSGDALSLIDYGIGFGIFTGGPMGTATYLGTPDNNWHQMVGVYGGGNIIVPSTETYFDGQVAVSGYTQGIPNITTTSLTIGNYAGVQNCCALTGVLDEVRISAVARSSDWIATEFNNQSDPSSFAHISGLYNLGPLPSSVLLSSSMTPSPYGQTLTLTALVSGYSSGTGVPAPGGSVTFYNGSSNLGIIMLGANGSAALSTSTLPVGSDLITARYSGDLNYGSSTSSVFTELVTPSSPTIISLDHLSGNAGMAVTISGYGFGAGQGQSTVTFNQATAAVLNWSDSSITTIVPNGATTGPVLITLVSPNAQQSNSVNFTIGAASCIF